MLEVYNDYDQKNLEQNVVNINWNVFKTVGQIETSVAIDNSIVFTEETTDDTTLNETIFDDTKTEKTIENDNDSESDIDMDEI